MAFNNGRFWFAARRGQEERRYPLNKRVKHSLGQSPVRNQILKFRTAGLVANQPVGALHPPFGLNLTSVLYTNKGLRRHASDLFRTETSNWKSGPSKRNYAWPKRTDDGFFSFPYESTSETWKRLIFYMAVLETNQNSIILLDEPEANTFPFYTAYLAERIALDESNQFFLTTHNPYVLSSIVCKAPVQDLAVFVVSMDRFYTTVKPVSVEGFSKILDYGPDAFLNLDKLVEE